MQRCAAIILALMCLSSCTSVEVTDYEANLPTLQLETFFQGKLNAQGVVKDRSGKVIRRFTATIDANWNDNIGTLKEDFQFDDGELQQRIWRISSTGDARYSATAGDVIGPAKLQVSGNSLFMDYVLRVPYKDSTIDLVVDDRMYLVSPDVLINESTMKKYGLLAGSILLVISREDTSTWPTTAGG